MIISFPRSHLPFPRSRNAKGQCTCFSSFLFFSIFLFHSFSLSFFSRIHRVGNSNEWKVFKRRVRHLLLLLHDSTSFNNGDALAISLCRMKKSRADGVSSRNFLSSPPRCKFISASAEAPRRCFNANVFCQKANAYPGTALISIENRQPPIITLNKFKHPITLSLGPRTPCYTPTEADRREDLVRNIHKNSGDFLMNRNYEAEGKYIITAMILLTNTCLVLLRNFFPFFFFYYPPPTCPFSLLGFSHREESCSQRKKTNIILPLANLIDNEVKNNVSHYFNRLVKESRNTIARTASLLLSEHTRWRSVTATIMR